MTSFKIQISMNSVKLLTGILAGFAAGAVVGILFAPERGSRTRRQIINQGENYADDLKGKFDDFVDSLNKKYQSTLHKAERMVMDGHSKPESLKGEKA